MEDKPKTEPLPFSHCYDCNIPKECTALGRCYFRQPKEQAP